MSESGYYPTGSEYDINAPFNEVDYCIDYEIESYGTYIISAKPNIPNDELDDIGMQYVKSIHGHDCKIVSLKVYKRT